MCNKLTAERVYADIFDVLKEFPLRDVLTAVLAENVSRF